MQKESIEGGELLHAPSMPLRLVLEERPSTVAARSE
jgi:hypothetical protein